VSNMNGVTRKKLYRIISMRDGEYCSVCKITSIDAQLVIDHIDNNNSNNDLDNLQLLCRRHNYLKNPRPLDDCVSDSNQEDESEINVNRSKEPLFRSFIYGELNEKGKVPLKDIINSGAEHVGISPVTAKRYLDKMLSERGLLRKTPGWTKIFIAYKENDPRLIKVHPEDKESPEDPPKPENQNEVI